MRILRPLLPWALMTAAGLAAAEGGLKVAPGAGFWSEVQTQLRFNAVVVETAPPLLGYTKTTAWSGYAPAAASVVGDYYFSKNLADAAQPPSGFRASGALLIRPPGVSLSDLAWSSRATTSLALPLHQGYPLADAGNQSLSAMPYLGIGYSDYSLKSGWGFWADIGLVMQSPGNALGMGRVLTGSQGVDDLVRELRLSPMLQLGVNYSF